MSIYKDSNDIGLLEDGGWDQSNPQHFREDVLLKPGSLLVLDRGTKVFEKSLKEQKAKMCAPVKFILVKTVVSMGGADLQIPFTFMMITTLPRWMKKVKEAFSTIYSMMSLYGKWS